jgi:hypothetical protein
MLETSKIQLIYILLKDTKLIEIKDKLVIEFSAGSTTHVSDMSYTEANLLIKYLQDAKEERIVRMRKKIIHLLCIFGMTNAQGQPDIDRIQRYIRGIGSRNPKKRGLWQLSVSEMRDVLNQVDRMVNKTLSKA